MKKGNIAAFLAFALAIGAPLAAERFGSFGIAFHDEIIDSTQSYSLGGFTAKRSYYGFGFNFDYFQGEPLGFFVGAMTGVITGVHSDIDTTLSGSSEEDLSFHDTGLQMFGNALVGIGLRISFVRIAITTGIGMGFDLSSTVRRYFDSIIQTKDEWNLTAAMGPGVSLGLDFAESIHVSCRAVYGMLPLDDNTEGFKGSLSIVPAIGFTVKL
jgi:hypothetical protein